MASSGVTKILNFLNKCHGFEKVMHNVKIISAGNGNCISEIKILPEQTNIFHGLHGGFATTLVDVLSSCALLTHEKGECGHVSVNLSIDFLKGAKVGDTILIDSKTLKVGKNLAFLSVEIKDKPSGTLLVKGSHTKYLLN
ncbi:acyl-coenzyme A thioesterase 13-like [Onthophagus taurus]|uniref:acyl-coenzyme A thioesterase 13-like n=1 Tax=Onthophagus taurus TaxID=166361 RepID=UPI0039BDC805